MKPMVRMASKRGAREMSVEDLVIALPPRHSAATSRDKTG
jgi:hypothetical protein